MSRHSSDASGRNAHLRARIADAAARLIMEHGIGDYSHAKRKAARQLGLPEGVSLPSNEEIDQAMIERGNLFEPEDQAALLQQLRHQAYEVMQVFQRFSPRLTGGLAVGAASEHSIIELDILAESSKEFEQFLINQNIEFKVQDRNGQMAYLVYAQPADVLVRLVEHGGRSGIGGGKPHLTLEKLDSLLADEK